MLSSDNTVLQSEADIAAEGNETAPPLRYPMPSLAQPTKGTSARGNNRDNCKSDSELKGGLGFNNGGRPRNRKRVIDIDDDADSTEVESSGGKNRKRGRPSTAHNVDKLLKGVKSRIDDVKDLVADLGERKDSSSEIRTLFSELKEQQTAAAAKSDNLIAALLGVLNRAVVALEK